MRVARGSLRSKPRSPKKEPNLPGEYGLVSFHSQVPGMVMPGMSCEETHTPLSITW